MSRTWLLHALLVILLAIAALVLVRLHSAAAETPSGIDAASIYESRCAGCHGPAAAFAGSCLKLKEDLLAGRYSGRDAEALLREGHGRLNPDEVAAVCTFLRAQIEAR